MKRLSIVLIMLMIVSIANADLILTINGLDATEELIKIEGKDGLVIAVAGSTETAPNAYHIKPTDCTLEATIGPDTVSPQEHNDKYFLAFGDESSLVFASLIANNYMIVDGTSVEKGGTIYVLAIFYIPETNTVVAFGKKFESFDCIPTEPECEYRAEAQKEPEAELEAESQPKTFPPLYEQKTKRLSKLEYFSKVAEDSDLDSWGDGYEDWKINGGNLPVEEKKNRDLSQAGLLEAIFDANFPAGFYSSTGTIEIPDDTVINTNTVWDSDVHLQGYVYVENAILIIKPGVTVRNAHYGGGIVVRNNGCIIANGTPESFPDSWIIFLSDTNTRWVGYHFSIKLEETASDLCEISYCGIDCAYVGIWNQNNRLENSIHDNSIWNCCTGIGQEGPMLADVKNNEIIDSYYSGIWIKSADVNGTGTNANEIYLGNNTIVNRIFGFQDYGIRINGVEDPNDAGLVTIANNLVVGSWCCSICGVNGWIQYLSVSNGFYANFNMCIEGSQMVAGEMAADSNSVVVIDDFESYLSTDELEETWEDYGVNGTRAAVSIDDIIYLGGGQSMRYEYRNNYTPYYSEAEVDIAALEIDQNWLSMDTNTLALYFYGQADNDISQRMWVKLTYDDSANFNNVEDFDSYDPSGGVEEVWQDYHHNGTRAEVFVDDVNARGDGQSMRYEYSNNYSPYYSDSEASTAALGIDYNWLGMDAKSLSLWFYGDPGNPISEQMYIGLTDGDGETAFLPYNGDMNDVKMAEWQEWNVLLQDFVDANDVNLANVASIIIRFGEPGGPAGSEGTVNFDDIRLYPDELSQHKNTAKVFYNGNPYRLKDEWWYVWNIPLQSFIDDNNNFDLTKVERIGIGFGDEDNPDPNAGRGIVYFDDIIRLCGNAEVPEIPENPYEGAPVFLDETPFFYDCNWPFLIKQDCALIDAGYGFIDEYPELIGKTDSFEGVPDTDRVDIGFHYFNWYYVNAGDSNELSADLNQDMVVNFKDFAVLAGGWLTTYDINDMNVMADEWLQMAEPNIQMQIYGDGNDGYVEVRTTGFFSDTQRVFLLADGQYAGEIFGFWDGDTITIDISNLSDGERKFKVVSVDGDRSITCSNITNIDFSCALNYCLLPSHYEPNKPLYFSAFNPSSEDVTVKAYADGGDLVWSQAYSGDSILGYIPAEITGQYEFDYISFDTSSKSLAKKITDPFDPVEPPHLVQALIVLPDWEMRFRNYTSVSDVRKAFEDRGIEYEILGGKLATHNKISKYARNIKYMYILAHGNYRLEDDGVLRTVVILSSGPTVSVKKSDYGAPSWCESLGGFWEEIADSFYSMGFINLEFAYFDCCYSGRLTINANNQLVEGQRGRFDTLPPDEGLISDLSFALGLHTDFLASRAYHGWYDENKYRLYPETNYQQWTRDMWGKLGEGDTVGTAMWHAIMQQTDFTDPNAPVNIFRFKGNGDIYNIRLVGD